MKTPKNYQDKAIKFIFNFTQTMIQMQQTQKVVLEAPTGSGKTFIMSKCIEKITKEINQDKCYIWISVGKGNLHEQSYYSVKEEISNLNNCDLAENLFNGAKDKINEDEIVFVNWDKINEKNKNNNWTNYLMRDKEQINFPEALTNTRNLNRKIILIIDESHYGASSERSLELIYDIIKPNIIIEMSATPIINQPNGYYKITPTEVKEEEMIKNDIIINQNLEQIYNINDEIDSTVLSLEAAYNQRLKLQQLYQKNNTNINPLVLIQIPNKDAGDDKKKIIEEYLRKKNITYENGKLYAWLDKEEKTKIDFKERMKKIVPFTSNVEFLIFKQAIDTGWDCPRAQILVKFRETQSIIFSTQTLGRILRMPEAKYYPDDELNTAYVFTNIEHEKIKIEKEILGGTIIKDNFSILKDTYQPINLLSYAKIKDPPITIQSDYYHFFEEEFTNYFQLSTSNSQDYSQNIQKLQNKGIDITSNIKTSILTNGTIPSEKIDSIKTNEINFSNLFGLKTSEDDLQYKFIGIIQKALNGFPASQSIPTVRKAIFRTFQKKLNISMANGGAIYSQSLVIKNEKIFFQILNNSIQKYKDYKAQEYKETALKTGEFTENWNIPQRIYYNSQNNIKYHSKLSIHQPLYLKKKQNNDIDELEVAFIDYLDQNQEYIDWYWKNGDEPKKTNFGISKPDGYAFKPDFLIKFKNGAIGIFDTKAQKYLEDDTKIKAEALYQYIEKERNKGKNIIGGIITHDHSTFRVNMNKIYISFTKKPDDWDYFDNLL